ncbi:cystatin-M [Leptodactylus fuscus]
MSPKSKKLFRMVKLIQDTYNENSDSLYWSKITKVERASTQVTNGIDYQLSVVIEPTGCLKEEDLRTCKTPGFDDMQAQRCHYFIKEEPPKFIPYILAVSCELK